MTIRENELTQFRHSFHEVIAAKELQSHEFKLQSEKTEQKYQKQLAKMKDELMRAKP